MLANFATIPSFVEVENVNVKWKHVGEKNHAFIMLSFHKYVKHHKDS